MNLSHAEIKDFALIKLGNNKWGEAIGVSLIFFIITLVAGLIPFGIASLLITGPLSLGIVSYFLMLNRDHGPSLNTMFSGFQNFGNAFLLTLVSGLIIGVAVFIAFIPIGVFLYFTFGGSISNLSNLEGYDNFPTGLVLMLSFGVLLLSIPATIVSIGLSQAFRIMYDDSNIGAIDALRKSWDLMKGRKWDFFVFNFSFIGWIILAMLTCGLGMVVLYPYMQASNAKYYDEITGGGKSEIDSIGEDLGKL